MGWIGDRLIAGVSKCSDWLNRICCVIAVIVGMIMTCSLVWGVFTRFVLNNPSIYTEEIARFCLIWLAFIGSSIAMKRKDLTSFRMLVDHLPEKGQRFMAIVGSILLLSYLIIFLKSGNGAMKIFMRAKAPVTKIPLTYPAMGLYIGACVMIVHTVAEMLKQIRDFARVMRGGEAL